MTPHGFERFGRTEPVLTERGRAHEAYLGMVEHLDPDQAAVVGMPFDTVASVAANAGSGKTHTAIARLLRYVVEGGDPGSAATVTFTRFAANNIKQRYADCMNLDGGKIGRRRWPTIGTCAAFALRLLGRDFGLKLAPLPDAQGKHLLKSMSAYQRAQPDYRDVRDALDSLASRGESALVAWPEFDRNGTMRRVHNVPASAARGGGGLAAIPDFAEQYRQACWFSEGSVQARLRDREPQATHVLRNRTIQMHASMAGMPEVDFVELLVDFQAAKLRSGMLDYTDMLSVPVMLMLQQPHLADRAMRRYRMFLIDEAQDLSAADFALISMVAGFPEYSRQWPSDRSFIMVGDSKQSLYWWRNGLPLVMDNLDRYLGHPNVAFRGLRWNYRSAADIVDASNAFSETFDRRNNFESIAVRPNTESTKIELHHFPTTAQEDKALIRRLLDLHREGVPWSDCAVLLRRNRDLDMVQGALIASGIPYRMRSNRRLTASEAFSFVSALLSLTLNPRNVLSVGALALATYGVGEKSIAPLQVGLQEALDRDLLATVEGALQHIPSKAAQGVLRLLQVVMPQFRMFLAGQPLSETLKGIEMDLLRRCNWPDLENTGGCVRMTLEAQPVQRVLQLLGNVIEMMEEEPEFEELEPSIKLHQICSSLALAEDPDEEGSVKDGLMLSTTHGFKGGEAKCVFLPRQTRATPIAPADADGERCIFNVGITRAQELLYISYADKIMVDQRWRKGVLNPCLMDFEAKWDFEQRRRSGVPLAAE